MKYQRGFIALTTVLVLSAIFLSLCISMASRAIGGADIGVLAYEADRTQDLAEGCVEYALLELHRSLNYAGDESILIDGAPCLILPILGTGNTNRVIQAQSSVSNHMYRVEVELSTVNPQIEIASWKPVTNFND